MTEEKTLHENLLIDEHFHALPPLLEVKKSNREGVLMTVSGPFGEIDAEVKNKRIYSRKLWEGVLKNPEVKAKLKSRSLFGEADHPQSFLANLKTTSHVTTNLFINEADGHLHGEADILDTPAGRIMKTLYDAGCRPGISSRGAGKVEERGGKSYVSESDYKFGGFDFVSDPSAHNAYPTPEIKEQVIAECIEILNEASASIENDGTKEYYRSLLEKIGCTDMVLLEETFGPTKAELREKYFPSSKEIAENLDGGEEDLVPPKTNGEPAEEKDAVEESTTTYINPEAEELREKVAALEKELEVRSASLTALETEYRESMTNIPDTNLERASLEDESFRFQSKELAEANSLLLSQLESVQNKLDSLLGEHEFLKEKHSAITRKTETLEEELENLNEIYSELEDTSREQQRKRVNAEAALVESEESVAFLETEVASLENERRNYVFRLAAIENGIEEKTLRNALIDEIESCSAQDIFKEANKIRTSLKKPKEPLPDFRKDLTAISLLDSGLSDSELKEKVWKKKKLVSIIRNV